MAIKLSIEEVKKRLNCIHGDLVILDDTTYINTFEKARFIDKEYGAWFASPEKLLIGQRHPRRALAARTKAIPVVTQMLTKEFSMEHMDLKLIRQRFLCGIYCIFNIKNGFKYIGLSSNIKKRWDEHIQMLKLNKHHSLYLQHAWNKYGPDTFKFCVIELTSLEELQKREQYWIDFYKSYERDRGYNMEAVSDGKPVFTSETRHKMRLAKLGKSTWNTDSWKQKVSEEVLLAYYLTCNSMRECSRKFKIADNTVRKILCKNGIMPQMSNKAKSKKIALGV